MFRAHKALLLDAVNIYFFYQHFLFMNIMTSVYSLKYKTMSFITLTTELCT